MRQLWFWFTGAALIPLTAANAADQLKFGKPPEWVVPQVIPAAGGKSPAAPIAIVLQDQQIRFEPGKTTTYAEVLMKLQTPEGLAAGNISLPWNPATDTVTINKLQIRRGNQIIDVLAAGQTFTTMRRETNLDLAMLDGVLTANIQPEGLQQGDIIDLAATTEHVDPVLGKHVETNFMQWGLSPIQLAHFRLDWPDSLPLAVDAKGVSLTQLDRGGRKLVEHTEHNVEPFVPPKGAPLRYRIGFLGEATDFSSWADVAAVIAPLYRKAEVIPATGPLHDQSGANSGIVERSEGADCKGAWASAGPRALRRPRDGQGRLCSGRSRDHLVATVWRLQSQDCASLGHPSCVGHRG